MEKLDWRPFADRLTDLAKAEGTSRFLDQAFIFLNDFTKVDSCAVFKVAADKTSGAKHLCTFGSLKPELAKLLADEYVAKGFKKDPMVQTALLSSNIRVRRLPRSHYSQSYQSQYFKTAKLVDKVSSIHATKKVLFLVNFYRTETHGKFTGEDFKDLERLAPIIGRFVLRHTRLTQDKETLGDVYEQKITRLVEDNTQVFARLSDRERQICKYILFGKEEKEIAKSCNITLNTVITHRRRLYRKLGIGSKAELFQLGLITQI